MSETAGRSALVTGGATGIGRAISIRLAQAGFAVAVLFLRSEHEAAETASAIRALGSRCCLIRADVTRPSEVNEAVRQAVAEHGGLD